MLFGVAFLLCVLASVHSVPFQRRPLPKSRLDPEEIPGLIEGDIIPEPESTFRSVIGNSEKYWTDGKIPFTIYDESAFTSDELRNLTIAMAGFTEHTCIRWLPKTDDDKFWVTFKRTKSGCSSGIGRNSNFYNYSGQRLLLGDDCFNTGTLRHEMMHSLGFYHEQSRPDRNKYISFNIENIEQGHMGNFRYFRDSIQDVGAPYDYGSLMHYPKDAFSIYEDEPTIETLVPGVEIGQRRDFSAVDIFKINKIYKCPELRPLPKEAYLQPPTLPVVDPTPPAKPMDRYTWRCYFDYYWACMMHDDIDADFDWKLKTGPTSSPNTGPSSDYDGKYDKFYAYTEATGRDKGDVARLITPYFASTPSEGKCFSFAYHMFGEDIGKLRVYTVDYTGKQTVLFEKEGDQGDNWLTAAVVIKSGTEFKIYFEGTLGKATIYTGNAADIAIDTLKLRPIEDESPCVFEI